MRGYNSARGDINIKRPHPRRTKIADKIFIVRPGGGGLVHCQIALLHFEFLHRPILELSLPFLLPTLRIVNFRMFRGKWKMLETGSIVERIRFLNNFFFFLKYCYGLSSKVNFTMTRIFPVLLLYQYFINCYINLVISIIFWYTLNKVI